MDAHKSMLKWMRGSMMIATCLEYSMRCSAGPLHHGACIHSSESNVNFRLKMLFDFRYTESNFNIQYSHTWLRFYCFVSGIWKKRLHVILLLCVYVLCAWCRCFVNIFGSIWKKIQRSLLKHWHGYCRLVDYIWQPTYILAKCH